MQKVIVTIVVTLICSSCLRTKNKMNSNSVEVIINKHILKSTTKYVTEDFNDLEKYHHEYETYSKSFFKSRYSGDTIYATKVFAANQCMKKIGDIEIKNDTIILKLVEYGKLSCGNEAIYVVEYVIHNPCSKEPIIR